MAGIRCLAAMCVVGVLSVGGCRKDSVPAPQQERPPAPAPACDRDVELSIDVNRKGQTGRYELVAKARNTTAAPIRLELPDRCPGGSIMLTGLPPNYDQYGTCVMGQCNPDRPKSLAVELAPGATTTLATIRIPQTCNAPLPGGRYSLSFALPAGATAASVCDAAPVAIDMPAPDSPPAPSPPAAPPDDIPPPVEAPR